jgi:hypothetical protein
VRTASAPILLSRKPEVPVILDAVRHRRATVLVQLAGVALVMTLALSACSRGPDSGAGVIAPIPCPPAGARVAVSGEGGIVRLNGIEVSPAALAADLRSLAPPPAVVCYYREAATSGGASAAPDVLEAIMSMRLPVLLFEDPDFARGVPLR